MNISGFKLRHAEQLFIGGCWRTPSTQAQFAIVHPGTGETVASVAAAGPDDVDAAVGAARQAFDHGPWPQMALQERVALCEAWAQSLERRAEELAQAFTTEIGVPIAASRFMAGSTAATIRSIIAMSAEFQFSEQRTARGGVANILREPVGVVAAIVPWNYPSFLGALKIVPALLAGCTVIVKPSPEAPLDLLLMAESAADVGFPEGVLSVIPADRDVGDRLIRDARIDKVSFTGSTAVGKHIGAVCMQRVARVSLELGGKSAAIVLDDAPLTATVQRLVAMSTLISGQACMALTRVLVSKTRARELTDALAQAYRSIRVGDPFDPATQMGPLASAAQKKRVETYIAKGLAEGARLVTGGKTPTDRTAGFFIEPTIFAEVRNSMVVAREEIFGPVICIIEYESIEEAISIANDSPYGLNGAIFTEDEARFSQVAARLRTGTVAQNAIGPQSGLPFGGYKQSGLGRENSVEAFELYTETKTVYVERKGVPA